MNYQNILVDQEKNILWIRLNRPDAMNALSKDLITELITALQSADEDDSVDVVILKGEGRGFCAGMDLKTFSIGGGVLEDVIANYGPWQAIEEMSKPTIAAVHGPVITGGYVVAIACDIIIAAENATFADTHARWGLIPYAGETQKLMRLVGVKKAKELMLTCERFSATEAEKWGIVNKVVPDDQLEGAARDMANKIIQNNQRAVRAIKQLMNFGADMGFASGVRMEQLVSKRGAANADPDEDREMRMNKFKTKDKKM